MPEVIKTRWLTDKEQNKIAPKTLASQILDDDGNLFKDKILSSLDKKLEEDDLTSITKDEIDAICGAVIYAASEVAL